MKKIMKKIGLYLFCALCVISFACCAPSNVTGGSGSQNNASDSTQNGSGTQGGSGTQDGSGSQDGSGTQDSNPSDSGNDTQGGDENELPRVPYGAE